MCNACPSQAVYWIWLNELRGIPLRTKRTLLELLGNPEKVFNASCGDIAEVLAGNGKDPVAGVADRNHPDGFAPLWSRRNLGQAESILRTHEEHHIETLCGADLHYRHIYAHDPKVPLVLYYRGKLAQPEIPQIGIIGSRSCSSYGRRVTREAVREAVAQGKVIASGLSFGIDALAHETTLALGGTTYAFLPCGLHAAQPAAHAQLMERIISNGAVVTPYSYGKEALPFRFIERNDLLAAWSDTLLVVEARIQSGSIRTARTAMAKGKRVFAVPNSLLEPNSHGTNHLLAEGAHVYLNDSLLATPVARDILGPHDANGTAAQGQGQRILTILTEKPLGTGDLVSLVGQETPLVMESLAAMEVADQVEYRSDGRWHRVGGP